MVTSIATMVMNRAPPRNTSHFVQSVVALGGGGGAGGGAGAGAGAGNASVGGSSVVKAPVALQALLLSELIALTFQ